MAFSHGFKFSPIQFSFMVNERDRIWALSQFKIQSKMQVSFWLHYISKNQIIILVLFELFDDNKPMVFRKVKFLWPNKDQGLHDFLKDFGMNVLINTELLWNTGINVSQAMFKNLEEAKVQEMKNEAVNTLAQNALERGIIILKDNLLEVPES
jgi:hypothetical protein